MKKQKKQQLFFRKGNRVILRPIQEEDLPQFQMWVNDPEVSQYLGQFFPASMEDERTWFNRISKLNKEDMTLAIVDSKTNKLIGSMGLHKIDYRAGTAVTGALIGDKNYWGKGYGSEAKMLFLEFAFHELNLRKIYSYVYEYNERSVAYSKKCGYVEEARLPAHYYRKGKYWAQIIMAVYRDSWEKLWRAYCKNTK